MDMGFVLEAMGQYADKEAVVSRENRITFADLAATYDSMLDRLSLIPDNSVVALMADFSAGSIAALLALIGKDCIVVPISNGVKNPERYREIAECEYGIAFQDGNMVCGVREIRPSNPLTLSLKQKSHPGIVFFSSGTTGDPKGAIHDLVPLLEKFKRPGKTLKTVTFLLFDHIGGFNTVMHAVTHGGTIVTVESRDADDVLSMVEREQVELLPTSPTFLNLVLLGGYHEKYDLSSLRIISYGTEPMPESTLKSLATLLPDVRMKQTYGLSELGIMGTKSEGSDSLWMKVGGEGFETRIVDGILQIRAKSAMLGYLNAPSPFDDEGWFDTKDKVLERDGYIKILGRDTDLINVGGEKVYPIEVESCLLECPGVIDARVGSECNPITGNVIVAEIQVEEGADPVELRRNLRVHCGERLEPFKRPARFKISASPLGGERLKKMRRKAE